MKFRRSKKKKMISICLEKDGDLKEFDLKVGGKRSMLKVARKLAAEGKKGWQLRDISGDPEFSAMFMGAVNQFKETGKIPIKRMVKDAGLSAVPGFIKKRLLKDEDVED